MNIIISSQNTMGDSAEQDLEDYMTDPNSYKRTSNDPIGGEPKRICLYSNEFSKTCVGVIMVHLTSGCHDFSKLKNTRAKDIAELTSNIEELMRVLQNDIHKFQTECEEANNSQEDMEMIDGKDISRSISENMEHIEENNIHHFLENKQEFKHPFIELTQSGKNRFSSSTSSSSLFHNSNVNRNSTTSTFSHSTASADVQKTDSDDRIVISETSDSSLEKMNKPMEDTIIQSQEEYEYFNIYAKWKTDKYFYAGRAKDGNSEREVIFDDDSREMVKITDILFMDLLPKETEVSVDMNKTGEFVKNCIVKEHVDIPKFRAKPKKGYRILNQITNQYVTVTRECVSVHMDIVRKIMGGCIDNDLNTSNISMENIVFGKRPQKPKRFSQFLTLEDIKSKRCASPSIANLSFSPYSFKSRNGNKKAVSRSYQSGLFQEGRGLFTNYYFMITGENDDDIDSDLSKESVEQTICAHNGCVIELPSQDLVKKYKNDLCKIFLVVLGKPTQTVKFMVSLAVGQMPIVQLKWVLKCVQCSKLVEYEPFLLPRGKDQDDQEINLNLNEKCKTGLFFNKNIWIVTDSFEIFGKHWQTILEISGAEAFIMDTSKFSLSISKQNCDFVVVDKDGVTNNCLRKLRQLDIMVLDISFVTDCLVKNDILSFDNYIL